MAETRIRTLRLNINYETSTANRLDSLMDSCESEGFRHVDTNIKQIKSEYFLYTLTFKQHKGLDL